MWLFFGIQVQFQGVDVFSKWLAHTHTIIWHALTVEHKTAIAKPVFAKNDLTDEVTC